MNQAQNKHWHASATAGQFCRAVTCTVTVAHCGTYAVSGCNVVRKVRVVHHRHGVRNDHGDVLANHLALAVPEHRQGYRVRAFDRANVRQGLSYRNHCRVLSRRIKRVALLKHDDVGALVRQLGHQHGFHVIGLLQQHFGFHQVVHDLHRSASQNPLGTLGNITVSAQGHHLHQRHGLRGGLELVPLQEIPRMIAEWTQNSG